MINPGLSLQKAMRDALLARTPLMALLGGGHVFDEVPRGAHPPFVAFTSLETRDWSVADQKAHEHFVTLEIQTNQRRRDAAQAIVQEIESALDMAALTVAGHALVNLRLIFATVQRTRPTENFAATMRFRAATEPV